MALVERTGADIGLAFDGDADRLGVVTNAGTIIWPDRLLMLLAKDLLHRNPGAGVIYDVKCTGRLREVITACGGEPIMCRTGHSHIKAKLRETGALLGGEFSGHLCFAEGWFGLRRRAVRRRSPARRREPHGRQRRGLVRRVPVHLPSRRKSRCPRPNRRSSRS